uniref:Uncharacterized protein n=1 Tax=Rhizophora mucronata TaxID=61149 RepID=A0A2P2Q8F9_RHIMU
MVYGAWNLPHDYLNDSA